jgi:glycosyltransferase involved in cell wall biosynthesis
MRIALTADPELPVPPLHYGGIERIIDMLARGLVARGHDVTLFAHPDSNTAGRLVPWPGRTSGSRLDTVRNTTMLARHVMAGDFDLVHSCSRAAYLTPILPMPLPKLMTYHRHIARRTVQLGYVLSRGTLWFSTVSRHLIHHVAQHGTWRLVFDGVPLARYNFCADPGPDAPLVFLGRLEEIKGPHRAIEVARRTGLPLIIAGNVPESHRAFFDTAVKPHIDGSQVTYVGPVADEAKNALLGGARALLMPISWEEPSGIVMPEAMACGTPVVGLNRGAVPEYVEHGVTGYVADSIDGLVDGVRKLSQISRAACRQRVLRLFSDCAVVAAYESVYREMIATARGRRGRG